METMTWKEYLKYLLENETIKSEQEKIKKLLEGKKGSDNNG